MKGLMNFGLILPSQLPEAVLATGALRCLKSAAATRLIGVLRPEVAPIFEGGPWLDECLVWPDWHPGRLAERIHSWASLRRLRVDRWLIFSQALADRGLAWWNSVAARPFTRVPRFSLLDVEAGGACGPSLPLLDRFHRLVQLAGCRVQPQRPELYTTAADEARAEEVFRAQGWGPGEPFLLVVNSAPERKAEQWPTQYFAILSRRIAEELAVRVLAAAPPAAEPARSIAQQANHLEVQAWPDALTPGVLKALVRRAQVVITTDALTRQMAAAFQRPSIALFGPQDGRLGANYHPREIQLHRPLSCAPCGKVRACPLGHQRCLRDLTPNEVFFAVRRHWKLAPAPVAA